MATAASQSTYSGYAILVVNSYESSECRAQAIQGTMQDFIILQRALEEARFHVQPLHKARLADYRSRLMNISYDFALRKYPCLLVLFYGYEEDDKLVFEDGKSVEYKEIFDELMDASNAWGKIPKVLILNTYKLVSRSHGVKSFLGMRTQHLPTLSSPVGSLVAQISHSVSSAEKRAHCQDTFVTKFISQLNAISSSTTYDFGQIIRQICKAVDHDSHQFGLGIKVTVSDQLAGQIRIKPTHFKFDSFEPSQTPLYPEIANEPKFTPEPFQRRNFDYTIGLDSAGWFVGPMSRDQSEDMLKEDGHFLIRQSMSGENHGRYVISVLHNGLLYQIPILITGSSSVFIKDELSFSTIKDLIEYYYTQAHILPTNGTYVRLKIPITLPYSSRVQPIPQIESLRDTSTDKWFHGYVSREYVQQCLKEEGDFLIWQSESCYILSFVCNQQIHCIHAYPTTDNKLSTDVVSGTFDDLTDLVEHLVRHYEYYRGVYLKTPIAPSFAITSQQIQNTPNESFVSRVPATPLLNTEPNNMDIIDTSIPLSRQPWFSKKITSAKAYTYLVTDGDFLMRESQTKTGQLCLSVKSGNDVHNLGVFRTTDGRYTLDANNTMNFETIPELINYYVVQAKPLPTNQGSKCFLIHPINVK